MFEELDREKCMPVNFALDGERILFRTREGSKLVAIRAGTVVGFEVDEIDASTGAGWSVTVIGEARIPGEPEAVRYRDGAMRTWADGDRDEIVAISTRWSPDRRLVHEAVSARCPA